MSANLRAQVGTSVCVCVLLLSPGIDYANSALSAEVLLTTREQNTVNFATSSKSLPQKLCTAWCVLPAVCLVKGLRNGSKLLNFTALLAINYRVREGRKESVCPD